MRIISKSTALRSALMACGLVVGSSAFVHPAGPVRAAGSATHSILQGGGASPAVLAIVERSCQNCHSEKTKWPWYSYIAPMSWMVDHDVSAARRHMNLTTWQSYGSAEKIRILSVIAPLVRNRVMPPQRYVALHPEAKLSAEEIDQLASWAHAERRSLGNSPAQF